jgi:hypothetical protein
MARNAILVTSVLLCAACGGDGKSSGGGASGGAGRSGGSGGSAAGTGGNLGNMGGTGSGLGGSSGQAGNGTGGTGGGGAAAGAGGAAGDAAGPPAGALKVTVAAGEHDRQGTIVSFMLGAQYAGRSAVLSSGSEHLPLQVDPSGRAVFVLPSLKAGAQVDFAMGDANPAMPAMTAIREADGVAVNQGGRKVLRYQMQGKLPTGVGQAFLRGGYLHPIFTPAGTLVTDDYPGDHRHHHGIWSAWASTTFEGRHIDFWNMGQRTAKVDFDGIDATWDGPVHAGFRSRQVHVDLSGGAPKTALKEQWVVSVYQVPGAGQGAADAAAAPPYFVFDIDSTQEAASSSPVMLDRYIYGGFAMRGHASWGGSGGATFLTAEGRTRGNGDGTTARWCHIGGRVNGAPVGYAALGHPGNFRAPQPVRINPTDPFFSFAPVQASGFAIDPGKPYLSRYRIVVSDGAADKALLDRLWNDYATPPVVTVTGQ